MFNFIKKLSTTTTTKTITPTTLLSQQQFAQFSTLTRSNTKLFSLTQQLPHNYQHQLVHQHIYHHCHRFFSTKSTLYSTSLLQRSISSSSSRYQQSITKNIHHRHHYQQKRHFKNPFKKYSPSNKDSPLSEVKDEAKQLQLQHLETHNQQLKNYKHVPSDQGTKLGPNNKTFYTSPYRRDAGYRRIDQLDQIPDDNEQIITELIQQKHPTLQQIHQHIKQTQERVQQVTSDFSRLTFQLSMVVTALITLGFGSWKMMSTNTALTFPLEHQFIVLPAVANTLLDDTFHSLLTEKSIELFSHCFHTTEESLQHAARIEQQRLLNNDLFRPAVPDSVLKEDYGPDSTLSNGIKIIRVQQHSPVYKQYDTPLESDLDYERYLTLSIDGAQSFLRLYLSGVILHLEKQMTQPIFDHLYKTDAYQLSLQLGKDAIWELIKRNIGQYEQEALTMLQTEAAYEGLKYNEPSAANASTNKITLRGLRRVLISFHFAIFTSIKEGLYTLPITMYQQAQDQHVLGKFAARLPPKEEYMKRFKQYNLKEYCPDLVLKYQIEDNDPQWYYSQAIHDLSNITRHEPVTMTRIMEEQLKDMKALGLHGF